MIVPRPGEKLSGAGFIPVFPGFQQLSQCPCHIKNSVVVTVLYTDLIAPRRAAVALGMKFRVDLIPDSNRTTTTSSFLI